MNEFIITVFFVFNLEMTFFSQFLYKTSHQHQTTTKQSEQSTATKHQIANKNHQLHSSFAFKNKSSC